MVRHMPTASMPGNCQRWGPGAVQYLTEAFFAFAAEQLRENLVLFSAHRGDPLRSGGELSALRVQP